MESNVPPADQFNVMVAVKCEGSEMIDYHKNYALREAADPGTVDAIFNTHSQIEVKVEHEIDFVHIKKEQYDSDTEYAGDVADYAGELQVKTELNDSIEHYRSDTVGNRKCRKRENNLNGLRSANRGAHCAELKTEDLTSCDCIPYTLNSCSDSVGDKCQISEVNEECSQKRHDTEISEGQTINAVSNAQTQAVINTKYISDNTFTGDAGDFASFYKEKLHLKSEEIDLGYDIIESDVTNLAEQKTEDTTLKYDCGKQTLDTCTDSDQNKWEIPEKYTECSSKDSKTISVVSIKPTQTNKMETYITGDTVSVKAVEFESFSSGKLHLELKESNSGCDVVKYSPNLRSHTDDDCNEFEKINTCKICDKNFLKHSVFKQHMVSHDIEKPHICNICDKKYAQKWSLYRHMSNHNDKKLHTCNICDKKFSLKYNLKIHMLKHTGEKPHKCKICKKKFSEKTTLNRHMFTHTGERPHKCVVCQRKFTQKSTLIRHQVTHSGQKPHKCAVCENYFANKRSLNIHLVKHSNKKTPNLSSHTDEDKTDDDCKAFNKINTCTICDKTFSKHSVFKQHMFEHNIEKPYVCNICDKNYAQKWSLYRHMLNHNDKKSYTCNICDKNFSAKYNLKVHTLKHTGERPHKCKICKKKFSDKTNLNRHMFMHTGERPYKCAVCQKKFTQKGTLTRHQLTHTGQKPHKCAVCEKYFTNERSLNIHLIKHSNKKTKPNSN